MQVSAKPGVKHVDQTDSKDGTEPEVQIDEAELKAPDAGMTEMFLMIEFQIWRAKRLANRQDKRYQARERLRQARENQDRPGRGRSTFVISVPTMLTILKYIQGLHTRSSHEVRRIMIMMYRCGLDFRETEPKVDHKTINRYLVKAFKDLQIWIGARKAPNLWTLKTSYNLRRDARIARVDLKDERFMSV